MTIEDLAVVVARIEAKLDVAISKGDDHETRIRALERKVWMAAGFAAAGGAGLSQFLGG